MMLASSSIPGPDKPKAMLFRHTREDAFAAFEDEVLICMVHLSLGGEFGTSPGPRDRIVCACRLFTKLPLHAGARARSQGLGPRRPSLDHAA